MKCVIRDVFDFNLYSKNGLAFKIDTAKSTKIMRDFEKNVNTLVIEDALLDTDVLNDINNGIYDNEVLRVVGKTTARSVETQEDVNVVLGITASELVEYSFPINAGELSEVTLTLTFKTKDAYGFQNAMLKVVK